MVSELWLTNTLFHCLRPPRYRLSQPLLSGLTYAFGVHPIHTFGSSETLQTSCCLQSTNHFYWDSSLMGHCMKARAETGTDCLFPTEIGARPWKEGQLMTGNLSEDGGRPSWGRDCPWMSQPVVQVQQSLVVGCSD